MEPRHAFVGALSAVLSGIIAHPGAPEPNHVSHAQRSRPDDPFAIDKSAVRRVVVDERAMPRGRMVDDLCVEARGLALSVTIVQPQTHALLPTAHPQRAVRRRKGRVVRAWLRTRRSGGRGGERAEGEEGGRGGGWWYRWSARSIITRRVEHSA